MKTTALCFALFLLLATPLLAEPNSADLDKMVTVLDAHPERVIELSQRFVHDPYASDARGIGSALVVYMTKSDKVNVHIHTQLFLPLLDKSNKASHDDLLAMAFTIGLLSDAVQNHGESGNTEASNVKALRTLAEAYTNMLKVHADQTNEFAARILALSKKPGELEKYVSASLADEKKGAPATVPVK